MVGRNRRCDHALSNVQEFGTLHASETFAPRPICRRILSNDTDTELKGQGLRSASYIGKTCRNRTFLAVDSFCTNAQQSIYFYTDTPFPGTRNEPTSGKPCSYAQKALAVTLTLALELVVSVFVLLTVTFALVAFVLPPLP